MKPRRLARHGARYLSFLTFSAAFITCEEKVKKNKYLAPCLARRQGFMSLVYSADGMAGKEAKSFERRIASLLAEK